MLLYDRDTPVMLVTQRNRADTVLQLQEAGADCQGALEVAERHGKQKVVTVLKGEYTKNYTNVAHTAGE